MTDDGYASVEELTAGAGEMPEADVKVMTAGRPVLVRVRGLSRSEALSIQRLSEEGSVLAIERAILAMAMVRPAMTEGQVKTWQDTTPAGDIEAVTDRIQELSATTDTAAKETYRRFATDPAEEFRLLPRRATGDDGGGDATPDVEP